MLEDLIRDILLPEDVKENSHYKFIWGFPANTKLDFKSTSLYTDNFLTISQDKLDNKYYVTVEDNYDLTDTEFVQKLNDVIDLLNFQYGKKIIDNSESAHIDCNYHNIYGVADTVGGIVYLLNLTIYKYKLNESLAELN